MESGAHMPGSPSTTPTICSDMFPLQLVDERMA
jgi:hypothetical protein